MIEQVERETEKNGGGTVETVFVHKGVLSGVDAQALQFAYELACKGSQLRGSRLEIESVRLLVHTVTAMRRIVQIYKIYSAHAA